eukprot:gene11109-13593_t
MNRFHPQRLFSISKLQNINNGSSSFVSKITSRSSFFTTTPTTTIIHPTQQQQHLQQSLGNNYLTTQYISKSILFQNQDNINFVDYNQRGYAFGKKQSRKIKIKSSNPNDRNRGEKRQPKRGLKTHTLKLQQQLIEHENDDPKDHRLRVVSFDLKKDKGSKTTNKLTKPTKTKTIKKEEKPIKKKIEKKEDEEKVPNLEELPSFKELPVQTPNNKYIAFKTTQESESMRLDRWVKTKFPIATHSMICKLIRNKEITIRPSLDSTLKDRRKSIAENTRIVPGEWVFLPTSIQHEQQLDDIRNPEENIRLTDKEIKEIKDSVLYKDHYIIIINKPQGLAVQGGSGLSKHLDMMLSHLKFDLPDAPRLCHRLDKDTSGILILGRTKRAAQLIADCFENKLQRRKKEEESKHQKPTNRDNNDKSTIKPEDGIIKTYWALLANTPIPREGRIRAPLKKIVVKGMEKVVATATAGDGAKLAITEYKVVDSSLNKSCFIALWPKTGRTHQLRVHCASILKSAIIGDNKYGTEKENSTFRNLLPSNRLHLHARRVQFIHPITNKKIDISAPLPPNMMKSWETLGFNPNIKDDMIENK